LSFQQIVYFVYWYWCYGLIALKVLHKRKGTLNKSSAIFQNKIFKINTYKD